ncbi:MAG: histidine kinase, partial [Rhodoglobus sp.]|nr:histidine kinase [Rhodoglobus sp.]
MPASTVTLAPPPQSKQPRNPISRKQVETVFARSVAVFGLVFGAQTIPSLLGQLDEAEPAWLYTVVIALYGTLVLATIASFAKILVKQVQGAFAAIYLLALISWPFAILPGAEIFTGIHWLNYLITVATAMAAIAFRPLVATTYLFVCATIYTLVRMTPLGGSAPPLLAVLEGVYAVLLGGVIIIIITMLRQAATGVDGAQSTALDRYAHAVRQHATEVERVQVDSIVHDSVLTTLISASRAYTPQATRLAATMATNTIGHLLDAAAASTDDGSTVRVSKVTDRISQTVDSYAGAFEFRSRSVGTRSMPAQAAEAVYSAAAQAMVNSINHAGETDSVTRWVAVRGVAPDGIEVIVGDTGAGFVLSDIPDERLGVRRSIVERLANAGGR